MPPVGCAAAAFVGCALMRVVFVLHLNAFDSVGSPDPALPGERTLRLTQSGSHFFVEIFERSTRLERVPVKPTRSRDALQAKLQQPLPDRE